MMNDSYVRRKFRECNELREENRHLGMLFMAQSICFSLALIVIWIWG